MQGWRTVSTGKSRFLAFLSEALGRRSSFRKNGGLRERTFWTWELTRFMVLSQIQLFAPPFGCGGNGLLSSSAGSSYTGKISIANLRGNLARKKIQRKTGRANRMIGTDLLGVVEYGSAFVEQ